MASIVVTGDTSGAITIAAPAVAGTNTLTLPASTGTIVVTGGAQTIEFADGSAAAPSITNSGDTNTGMFFPAADTIAFTEGGTESMRIDSSGNVGIGTSTITSGAGWTPKLVLSANTPAAIIRGQNSQEVSVGSFDGMFIDCLGNTTGSNNNIIFRNTASNSTFSATERMRITSAGLFGFNASDPATFSSGVAQAVIERTSAGNNTVALALVNRSGTTNTSVSLDFNPNTNIALAQIRAFRTDASFGGGTDLRFLNYDGSALAERMRIDSNGWLYLNTTSRNDFGFFNINYSSGIGIGIGIKQTNSGGGTMMSFLNSSGGFYGSITNNGTNTAFNTSSDYRLKENIAPMTGALNKIALLKPCTYIWKETGTDGQGFIAHELQEVFPDAVHGEKDAVNEDGSVKAQGIDTSYLVATLTAAIQEQQQIINDLKARIETLEGAK